jgi:hypothetical protein
MQHYPKVLGRIMPMHNWRYYGWRRSAFEILKQQIQHKALLEVLADGRHLK